MRRLRKIAVVIGLILVIVLVGGTGWGVVTVRRSFPMTEGTVAVPGLAANVDGAARRLRHPAASTPPTRPPTCSGRRATCTPRTGSGRWTSAATSPPAACRSCSARSRSTTDTFLRTLGWRRVAEQELTPARPDDARVPAGLRATA